MPLELPSFARISDYPAWVARRTPGALALALGDVRLSYATVADRIDALAKALLALGITKGDRVATLQTPHPDAIIAFLAAASIGAIWTGLNPRYSRAELCRAVDDARPALLLARSRIRDRDYTGDLLALATGAAVMRIALFDGEPEVPDSLAWPQLLALGETVSDAALAAARAGCGDRDPCLLVYTSGSTGTPKGALLHHAGIIAFSLAQNRLWPVESPSALNFLPIDHIGCIVDVAAPVIVGGGALHFMEHFDPGRSLSILAGERLTIWGGVPTVFAMQLAQPDFAEHDLSAVQLIVWEGAAAPIAMIESLRAICPRLATNYGMTETTSAITIVAPTGDLDILENSVGTAFPGTEIRLTDADGGDVAPGETGEVLVRSNSNFLGYWQRPEATRAAFAADNWFRTGDLAMQRPDGRYRLVGRIKEMFKSGGHNVYPREIEAVLEAHPAVALAIIVPVADALWQEVGFAWFVPRGTVTPADLAAWCRDRLANFKIPKHFEPIADPPWLPVGKIDRLALRDRAASRWFHQQGTHR